MRIGIFSYVLMFVVGAIAGPAFDYIHVYYGVLSYAAPDFGGTELKLVVPLFGVNGMVGMLLVQFMGRRLKPPSVSAARLALDATLLAVGYFATGLLVEHDLATAACLAVFAAITVGTRPSRFVLVAAGLAGVIGPLAEVLITRTGVFHYNFASPVPLWLPLLWIIASGVFLDIPVLLLERKR